MMRAHPRSRRGRVRAALGREEVAGGGERVVARDSECGCRDQPALVGK